MSGSVDEARDGGEKWRSRRDACDGEEEREDDDDDGESQEEEETRCRRRGCRSVGFMWR